jgi:6-phosphogluconolactonase
MKIRIGIIALFSFVIMSCSTSQSSLFLVGTYTDNPLQGINSIRFNEATKIISLENVITGVENPSFVIANKAKTIVVSVEETASKDGGKVTSFSYDSKSNSFSKLSSLYTKGDHPCTLAFSPNENFVVVGNYSGGNLSVFPINATGILSDAIQTITYEGKSTNEARQEKAHVHSVVFHPKEKTLFVADLGRDAIEIIPFDENSKAFLQNEKSVTVKVAAGSGPRHLVWNKSGSKLYVIYELTNEVAVFDYNNKELKHLQTIGLLTVPTQNGSAAEIRLSHDGKFIYASIRGNDNQLVVLKTNAENKLEVIQRIATGKAPRNFILTNNEKSILVANQLSKTISVYNRDKKTGLLTLASNEFSCNKPVYLFEL